MQIGVVQGINKFEEIFLSQLKELTSLLFKKFEKLIVVDKNLNRKIISFQANKTRPYYKWYRYKESFSADFIEYIFKKNIINKGTILDPFAGAGTTLFACSSLGYDSEGIELLPIGKEIIEANVITRGAQKNEIISALHKWLTKKAWNDEGDVESFEILTITKGAYTSETHHKIKRYLNELNNESATIKKILLFVLLCVLESISYTKKDGQYLRWDHRADRQRGKKKFNKGHIYSFDEAVSNKINEIKNDMSVDNNEKTLFTSPQPKIKSGDIKLLEGSCLEILPSLENEFYSGIITSPPYCNRYDYTRTYALEHALLNITGKKLIELRQAMLSCTVENKEKNLIKINKNWKIPITVCDNQPLLQKIIEYLEYKKNKKELNNSGVPRMVKGYFYEMSCVIYECYRVLKKNSQMFMVNDNVRYAGITIPVDIILSKIADDIGFNIENILILPQDKGNSSQQMKKHGREALRKSIYVWKK